jgi:hypothetical protein
LATSGPVIDGVVIAVEAGGAASAAGAAVSACWAQAAVTSPNCEAAATARIAPLTGTLPDKTRFIRFFPLDSYRSQYRPVITCLKVRSAERVLLFC